MSSGIEPELRRLLTKTLRIIVSIVSWAIINSFFGLYLEWAVIMGHFNTFNAVFYTWFVISLAALIYFLYRTGRK
ncbi:MAG: hypothetical protein M9933_18920 [Chitinophagaceae bacterium]|nr:hypothetical protein [Chitinophagaceae bacterium]